MRTFASLATMPLGFDRDPVLLVELDVQRSRVPQERRADLYARLGEAAAGVPGVERAATSFLTPVSGLGWNNAFDIPGQPNLSLRQRLAFLNAVTPGWHSVYGTRLIAGREFTTADREGSPEVAIVNQAYVKKFLPAGNALGQVVQQSDGPWGRTAPARDGDRRRRRRRRLPRSARADAAHRLSADRAAAGRQRVSQWRCQRPCRSRFAGAARARVVRGAVGGGSRRLAVVQAAEGPGGCTAGARARARVARRVLRRAWRCCSPASASTA